MNNKKINHIINIDLNDFKSKDKLIIDKRKLHKYINEIIDIYEFKSSTNYLIDKYADVWKGLAK
jgi:hypothetical protein